MHPKDCVGLRLGQLEFLHQGRPSGVDVLRPAYRLDDLVDVGERDEQAFEYVRAFLRLRKQVSGPPSHHLEAMLEEALEHLFQVQRARPPVHQRDHHHVEAFLQLRVLEELIDHDLFVRVPAKVYDKPRAFPVALVTYVGYVRQLAALDQIRYLLQQSVPVELIRDLGHDNGLFPSGGRLDVSARPEGYLAPTRPVCVKYPASAADQPPCREVRALDDLSQLAHCNLAVVYQLHKRVAQLRQIVRRDAGRHSHRDAGGAVAEKVGDFGRKNLRLSPAVVIVGSVIDRILIDVLEHLHGERGHPRFRIALGRRRVAVLRAEVPLPFNQGIAQDKILRQAHEGRIEALLAERMVIPEGVSGDLRTLSEPGPGPKAKVVHRHEEPALRRLQAVPHVRQRTGGDNAHRVQQIRAPHLPFNRQVFYSLSWLHGTPPGLVRRRCPAL